jgi:alpha-L-rhamnosidase
MPKRGSLFIVGSLICTVFAIARGSPPATESARFDISQHGAVADGKTVNTAAIQAAIDQCAAGGGGTLVVPKGEFLSGSLFLKPGVNVELLEGAVLKGSPNPGDYEVRKGERFEGHFAEWRTGLLNAQHTDHLRITGPGTLNGNGAAFWSTPAPQGRPRLCAIRDSSDVVVSGVHFMSSAIWNLHLYNCQDVTVENCRFEILDGEKGPSTDGTDVDSSQNVTIRGCFYSVNDDCVCIKGNRYDGLNQEPASPPSSNVHITDCTFRHGMGALSLGTEATVIRDIEMDHCTVLGKIPMLRVKMRPDTPGQDYQNIRVHEIKLDGKGTMLSIELTHGTKALPKPPRALIKNIAVSDITGKFGSFGVVANNPNTDISDISLKDINVNLVGNPRLNSTGATGLTFDNVIVNDQQIPAGAPTTKE